MSIKNDASALFQRDVDTMSSAPSGSARPGKSELRSMRGSRPLSICDLRKASGVGGSSSAESVSFFADAFTERSVYEERFIERRHEKAVFRENALASSDIGGCLALDVDCNG